MSTLQFWKPGTSGPGSSLDRATETEENVVPSAPSSGAISIQSARERLPIFKHSEFAWVLCGVALSDHACDLGEKLLYCMEKYGVVILVGQTGSGKTTRACACTR